MKNIFIIASLLMNIQLFYAQNLSNKLQGEWVSYKLEMKDGSKPYSRLMGEKSYIKFIFKNNTLTHESDPTNNQKSTFKIDFTTRGSSIQTSPISGYSVEKITKDTLILSENFEGTDDKLKRFYLINQKSIAQKIKTTEMVQDSYIANSFFTPTLKEQFSFKSVPVINFNIKGQLVVDLVNKKINTIIDSTDNNSDKLLKSITKELEDSYKNWDFTDFEQFKTIEIPFYISGIDQKQSGGPKLTGITVSFINEPRKSNSLENIQLSKEFYNKALTAIQNSDLEKAIEYFTQSYNYDKYNIDALYSRAAINFHYGDKTKACEDWKLLNELGQVKGRDSYNQNCN